MPPPSPNLLLPLLLLLLSSTQTQSHTIKIPSSIPRPSGISWDPTLQHFILFSSSLPTISSISDAGVTETLISSPLLSSSVSSIALDNPRRRLLVSLLNPPTIAAFDLRSSRPHPRIFSSPLPSSPSTISLDPHTGSAFVGSNSGAIWIVDLDGKVSHLSKSEEGMGMGISALAHVRNGFLLAIGKMGRILKVDDESGAMKEVGGRNWAQEMKGIVLMGDGRAVVAWEKGVRIVKSVDGWSEGEVKGEVKVEEGKRVEGVAIREGKKAYVLVREEEELGGRIEEVEWEEEGDLLWVMVMVGFGLAYFLYWRFQMGKLVSSMSKKRA